jgi:hypothetical protein
LCRVAGRYDSSNERVKLLDKEVLAQSVDKELTGMDRMSRIKTEENIRDLKS